MRVPILSVVAAVSLAIACIPSVAFASEAGKYTAGNSYSVVELNGGESVSIPHGYDIGIIEEKASRSRMLRSTHANTAPSCIEVQVEKLAVQVYNNCGVNMRVKVIMASHTSPMLGSKDTACKTVPAGKRTNVRWIIRGIEKVDRIENC